MSIASFFNKVFMVSSNKIHTFSDLQFGSSLETETQDNPGGKPKTYIKGSGLSTFSIKISESADLGVNVEAQVDAWKAIKDAGIPYPFILGGKPFGADKWLLKDVQVSEAIIGNSGNFMSAIISLSFEEYVSPGKATAKKTSAGKKGPKAKVSVYGLLSPSEKKTLKAGVKSGH